MRIGVLADTHDRLPETLIERLAEMDEIWHLGDVCSPMTLVSLEDKPLHVVRGNCDSLIRWPINLTLTRENIRFYLVHIPPSQPPAEIDVVLSGHTHTPQDEIIKGVRFLNPGSVSKPRDSSASFGILEIENGAIANWKIMNLE